MTQLDLPSNDDRSVARRGLPPSRLATAGHNVLLTDHNDGRAASVAREIGDASGSVTDRPLADVLGSDVVAGPLGHIRDGTHVPHVRHLDHRRRARRRTFEV